ncbi:MAG TPA: hypothetical protein PKU91_06835, partial [Phycisphaerales bacterium]|nr:hypothetical protein [Phycisphaerales bacterium]
AAALVATVLGLRDDLGVAKELDTRAGLRESLSTALCVGSSEDPWSRAVVETARERARSIRLRETLPFEPPRAWPMAVGSIAALALAWFVVPTFDLLRIIEKRDQEIRRERELVATVAEITEQNRKLDAMLEKAGLSLKDGPGDESRDDPARPEELKNPEEVRRAAVKRLSDAADRLGGMKDGEKSRQIEALKEQLRHLRPTSDGPLHEFQRQVARGNFDQARRELEEMARAMADGSMSDQDAEKARKQLDEMARQLDRLAQDKQRLEQDLLRQGLTPQQASELMKKAAAGDPNELRQAIEELRQLSPEQAEQLMNQAMARMQAQRSMERMSEATRQMSEGMRDGQMGQQDAQGMQDMMGELTAAEMMDGEIEAARAAMGEIQAQLARLGKGLGEGGLDGDMGQPGRTAWKEGESRRAGLGSGGPGQGLGDGPEAAPTDYSIKKEKANVTTRDGPLIGSRLVWGEQVIGESRAAFSEAVDSSSRAAAEALETMQVPRPFHGAVKSYFGTLNNKAGAKSPPSSPAREPAADSTDAGTK